MGTEMGTEMETDETMQEERFEERREDDGQTRAWTAEFFEEESIVNTFQNLLHASSCSVEDLCRLCVAAREDNVVLAMNLQGLMPFANNPEFVFPFAAMKGQQLRALRRAGRTLPDAMACEYDMDVYVLKVSQPAFAVDHALLLFAAGCILLRGLSQTQACAHGFCSARLTKAQLEHHANAVLFQIVHACAVRRGALPAAARLLRKHRVEAE